MDSSLHRLLPLYAQERARGQALVLATLVEVAGSTYRKPGAQLLISARGEYAGLLSGGCLEGDILEHAARLQADGIARLVRYELRNQDDRLFGLGSGCEGAMSILLQRIGPLEDWQPFAYLDAAMRAHRPAAVAFVLESQAPGAVPGMTVTADRAAGSGKPDDVLAARLAGLAHEAASMQRARWIEQQSPLLRVLALPLVLPPRLLLLGGGPDAVPVVELAASLGWKTTVVDHRPAYIGAQRFALAERVVLAQPQALHAQVTIADYAAAVVMSHHFDSDLAYLRALAASDMSYIGLLGPPARREKLLAELGAEVAGLRLRLRAPIGLDIGARTPEAIALAIVAEIHAVLEGREGGAFSTLSIEQAVVPRATERA
ncbi:MAG TPA: XdhC family protein [Steroidobacteraceae bacterium]